MEPRVNKILKKLNNEKIKLATQKVDLAGIEDLEEAQNDLGFFLKNVKPEIAKADKILDAHDQLRKQIDASLKDMLGLEKQGQNFIDDGYRTYDKVEKQLKALGLNNSNAPMMGQLLKSLNQATTVVNDLNQLYDYLQSTT